MHYAMGGVQQIANQMAKVIEGQGGLLRMETVVDEILLKDGRAAGMKLKTGEVMGVDIVVSNADADFTYRHLMRNHPRKGWTDKKAGQNAPVDGSVRLVFRNQRYGG